MADYTICGLILFAGKDPQLQPTSSPHQPPSPIWGVRMFSQSVTAATAAEAQQQAEQQVHDSLQVVAPPLARQYQIHTHAVFAGHLENLKVAKGG